MSPSFIGYPALGRPLPPSTSPNEPGFNPRSYWRGPVWPVIDWLLWWALARAGEYQLAERLRESSLELIGEEGFGEYFEPFTGEPLGSSEQSWTAAVVLDWLRGDDPTMAEVEASKERHDRAHANPADLGCGTTAVLPRVNERRSCRSFSKC